MKPVIMEMREVKPVIKAIPALAQGVTLVDSHNTDGYGVFYTDEVILQLPWKCDAVIVFEDTDGITSHQPLTKVGDGVTLEGYTLWYWSDFFYLLKDGVKAATRMGSDELSTIVRGILSADGREEISNPAKIFLALDNFFSGDNKNTYRLVNIYLHHYGSALANELGLDIEPFDIYDPDTVFGESPYEAISHRLKTRHHRASFGGGLGDFGLNRDRGYDRHFTSRGGQDPLPFGAKTIYQRSIPEDYITKYSDHPDAELLGEGDRISVTDAAKVNEFLDNQEPRKVNVGDSKDAAEYLKGLGGKKSSRTVKGTDTLGLVMPDGDGFIRVFVDKEPTSVRYYYSENSISFYETDNEIIACDAEGKVFCAVPKERYYEISADDRRSLKQGIVPDALKDD